MSTAKKGAKKILKPFVKGADRLVFSNRKVKNATTKFAGAVINRYTNNGSHVNVSGPRHYFGPWNFMLDTPKLEKTNDKKAYVSGWFVPEKDTPYELRLSSPTNKKTSIRSDIKRYDVAEELGKRLDRKVTVACGFGKNIVVEEDGEYSVEARLDGVWKKLVKFDLRYDPDFTVSDIMNGNMAQNAAAHKNLISNKKQYFHEKESKGSYKAHEGDVKLVTFYLPQYHPFKENDEWWGKGFTEWSNVASAVPRYVGHEQPKLPADLGFYDLRVDESMHSQIEMAKKYGVHAFCFYYYWFSGRRLLEQPLDTFLKHKEWDFNFMICWANENWTRRWDGRNQDVLIAQENNPEDPLEFIKDVEPTLLDKRYTRVDGKPVLVVYRAGDLDDPNHYSQVWREYFKKKHNVDLHLLAVQSFSDENPADLGFDKGIEFVPLSVSSRLKKDIPRYNIVDKILDVEFTGAMYDYRPIALTYPEKRNKFPAYRSVMPAWDNDARRKGTGGVFANANPDLYGSWLSDVVGQANKEANSVDEKMVFINAWNEWAEGAYLEPDTMYGHAYLNRTAEVMAKHSNNPDNRDAFPMYGIERSKDTTVAVVLHLFYPEMWSEFKKHFKKLDKINYDLFVTVPKKAESVREEILKFKPSATVIVVPNRGRDVLPFLHLARRLNDAGYEKFLKMHSKKSMHRKDGNLWINDMMSKLIPSSATKLNSLMTTLSLPDTGIVGPYGHYISLDAYFGSNEEKTRTLLDSCVGTQGSDEVIKHLDRYGFFAGTMFWGRFDAIESLLNQYYQPADFEYEAGQLDSTLAHAIERGFTVIPYKNGKNIYTSDGGHVMQVTGSGITSRYEYALNKKEVEEVAPKS